MVGAHEAALASEGTANADVSGAIPLIGLVLLEPPLSGEGAVTTARQTLDGRHSDPATAYRGLISLDVVLEGGVLLHDEVILAAGHTAEHAWEEALLVGMGLKS